MGPHRGKPKAYRKESARGANPTFVQSLLTLYVVPNCPLCDEARQLLKQYGVEYIERDVANDFGALRAMYELTRQRLVPVFEAEGRALVRPSEKEMAEFLSTL